MKRHVGYTQPTSQERHRSMGVGDADRHRTSAAIPLTKTAPTHNGRVPGGPAGGRTLSTASCGDRCRCNGTPVDAVAGATLASMAAAVKTTTCRWTNQDRL